MEYECMASGFRSKDLNKVKAHQADQGHTGMGIVKFRMNSDGLLSHDGTLH